MFESSSTKFQWEIRLLDSGYYEAVCKYIQTSQKDEEEPVIKEFTSSAVSKDRKQALVDAMTTAVAYLGRIDFQLSGKTDVETNSEQDT